MLADHVAIAVSDDGGLRIRAAVTSALVSEALVRHLTGALAAEALARALSATAVYPASWKDVDRIAIQWAGRGVLGGLMTEFRDQGRIRGFVKEPTASLATTYKGFRGVGYGLLPDGYISVMRQAPSGAFGQSQCELTNGEVDEDLEGYFRKSEQRPTRLRTVTSFREDLLQATSRGIFVEVLPGGDPQHLPDVLLHERLDPNASPEELMAIALGHRRFKILESLPLTFTCPCSRERIEAGLGLLDVESLTEMIAEDHGARVRCEFCANWFLFDEAELAVVLERRRKRNSEGSSL